MLNDNHKNSNCADNEPLISYLYNEIGAAGKVEFEAHLETCADCRSDLTEFGSARTAVREWRGAEFDKLATPIFEIPTKVVQTSTLSAKVSRSRLADWRQIFAFKPALAMSVCALLIGLFGAAMFIFNLGRTGEIVKNTGNQNSANTIVSPTVENIAEQTKPPAIENPDKPAAPVADLPSKAIDKKFAAPKTSAVKAAANASKNNLPEEIPVKLVQNTNKINQKSAVAQKAKAPRLTETEDEEDDSVRLADLFDEIGTR